MFYRSASLYHPQRRAILHLKSIKRKIKEKNKSQEDTQPFFDVSCLKSVTFRIFLVGLNEESVSTNKGLRILTTDQSQAKNQVAPSTYF